MPEGLDLKGKRVLVVGLGKSGVASAIFLQDRGARVTVSDTKTQEQLKLEIPTLLDRGITVETGRHGERTFQETELIVVSPGVPFDEPHLVRARQDGIPVIGEIELASRFLKGRIIAITGSNGKTTTTALVGTVIAEGGFDAAVGGNIGIAAIWLVPQANKNGFAVLEVSSFQLETIVTFRPFIAVVINVTPDHLDRHGSFAGYAAAKGRIFENQTAEDYAVLNAEDETCREYAKSVKSQVRWFSTKNEVEVGAFICAGKIVYRDAAGEREIMPISELQLKGAHNHENVLAAVCSGMIAGCAPGAIRKAVSEFKAVEHRLEFVATVNGVQYYNDSKATNVDATIKALESFPSNIHIILGGKDKGSDYTVLKPLLKQRAKRVYTIGAAAEKIEKHLGGVVDVVRSGTLENAVRQATSAARDGDVVVLAPACASFDQFNSYEHRGKVFKELVSGLKAKETASSL
jgi:UDP-N-acetylmuramoylalanine--D-glutamate ligase